MLSQRIVCAADARPVGDS